MTISDEHRQTLEHTLAVVKKIGNQTDAAKELGIPRSTLRGRIEQANRHGLKPRKKQGKTKGKDEVTAERIIALEKQVAQYKERLDKLKASKFKLPTASKPSKKGAYCRVVIPDTHGCYLDHAAFAAFLGDLENLAQSVKEVVLLGDHLDCGGFLAQHQTLGYVAESLYNFEDDVNATNQLLDKIQELCPKADYHYLEGNHERRIERWCVTQAIRNSRDADYLQRLFGVESNLHLAERNIAHYRQGKFYHGLPIPATIKLGHCHFTHGSRTNKHAAKSMLDDFAGNVVFGHTHRMDSYTARTVSDGVVAAWCPGCLCRLQPLWNHTQITGWSHGYGLQLVMPDGTFLHINVPIIEGKSYLIQLTGG